MKGLSILLLLTAMAFMVFKGLSILSTDHDVPQSKTRPDASSHEVETFDHAFIDHAANDQLDSVKEGAEENLPKTLL